MEYLSRHDGFNSTMVRLKVVHEDVVHFHDVEFQFHNGSIKSYNERHRHYPRPRVSIPQWFD